MAVVFITFPIGVRAGFVESSPDQLRPKRETQITKHQRNEGTDFWKSPPGLEHARARMGRCGPLFAMAIEATLQEISRRIEVTPGKEAEA